MGLRQLRGPIQVAMGSQQNVCSDCLPREGCEMRRRETSSTEEGHQTQGELDSGEAAGAPHCLSDGGDRTGIGAPPVL